MSASQRGSEVGVNLSIVKKGLLLAAIPLLTQLLFLAALFKMRRDQQHAQGLAMHSKEVIARIEGFFRVVLESRSAVSSLTLTGSPVFGSAWEKSRHETAAQLLALRDLVSDNPAQQARIDGITEQTGEALRRLETIAQMARQPETRNKAVAAVGELWVQQFVDELRRELDAFLGEEEQLDSERQRSLERIREEETWTLIGGAVLAVLSTAGLAFVFQHGIASRLAVLMDNVHRIGAGERLPAPIGGRDELGRLDRVFHEMADTLDQKDRENELFVYSVSHDLRSPLVNLQGFSQELSLVCQDLRRLVAENGVPSSVRERVDTLLDHDANESIQFIQTAVRRLATIIDALLRLSRVGRVVYDWQQVDVRSIVERVAAALGNTIAQKGARITIGDLPPAWGDATAIEQIFANLLGNALNYLDPARPGIIEVGSGNSHPAADAAGSPSNGEPAALAAGYGLPGEPAALAAGLAAASHTYYVKDNGLGIEPAHLPKIFLAFQRLHPTAAPGEGIGLSLVRRMVERHGGRIWVESAVGRGSTLFVTLPAHPVNGALENGHVSEPGELNTWQRSRSA